MQRCQVMTDDIDAGHAAFVADGVETTDIERSEIHDSFDVTGPSGYSIPVHSSHAVGIV